MLTLAILCLALDSMPSAEADRILRLHLEAAGGEAALRRITSRRSQGTLERHGHAVPVVTHQRAPNLVHVETLFPRPGTLRQGFDGRTAWVLHPLQGGRVLDARESATFASQAWLHPSLHLAEAYPLRRWVGQEVHEGREVVVLALGSREDALESWRFDAATHRLLRIERKSDGGPHGEVPVIVTFEDYRAVDGIVIPFTVRTRVPLFETVLRLDRVEHNRPLDEGLFQKPF
jgi:hypothetical protein